MKKSRIALTLALVGVITLAPLAASAAGQLIEATPASVAIIAPSPGEKQHWDMEVVNLTGEALPLSVSVTGESEGLFDGPAPLQLELREVATSAVVYSGPVADVLNASIELPPLAGSSTYELAGVISLPASAGNQYQNANASLTFEFTTIVETPDTPGLAITGGVLGPWLWISVALLAAGLLLLAKRKRSKA